jgi:hypothetical protein
MKKKNKLIILIAIALIIAVGIFFLFIRKTDDESQNTTDFSKITECQQYLEESCELTFEEVKIGEKTISIRYEIHEKADGAQVIKFYFDEIKVYEQEEMVYEVTSDLYLSELAILDDVFVIIIGKEDISATILEESGAVIKERV